MGGLSVLKALRNALPQENFVYVADSAHAPYGNQPHRFIEQRASAMVQFLHMVGTKAIVVACNTATVIAVEALRSACALPIVAMEPAIKPAVLMTKSGIIGVLATARTLESAMIAKLCHQYGQALRIILMPCPGLVEQVERGDLASAATRALLAQYIDPLLAQGADTIVLGCTHYVFLASLIRELVGPAVAIVESSAAVARQLQRRIDPAATSNSADERGQVRFFTTGSSVQARDLFSRLWGAVVNVQSVADYGSPATL